jgi:hypothetical protein
MERRVEIWNTKVERKNEKMKRENSDLEKGRKHNNHSRKRIVYVL